MLDVNSTIREVKEHVFAQEIERGTSVGGYRGLTFFLRLGLQLSGCTRVCACPHHFLGLSCGPLCLAGLSVRVIFLGRELADSDSLADHLRVPARAAAAGPCATSPPADASNAPGATLHAVISSRPPSARGSGVATRTYAGVFWARLQAYMRNSSLDTQGSGRSLPCGFSMRGLCMMNMCAYFSVVD